MPREQITQPLPLNWATLTNLNLVCLTEGHKRGHVVDPRNLDVSWGDFYFKLRGTQECRIKTKTQNATTVA